MRTKRRADGGDLEVAGLGDPQWYKDAILYELHVRAFQDSNEDGIGDFPGLTSRLDYLRDLGVTALWLLPFYPSPLRDDGYDTSDYTSVHPSYGTLADFKVFLREAHRRGLRVITELVLNHTSDQHPWFQRARRAPAGSPHRDFYVWSDTAESYREARIIFKDFETSNWSWDPLAKAYFWHRFYSHQPDLNFDNPAVHRAMLKVVDFWLDLGVDGLRLDAVPYLYEREGTNCENLAETHAFLKELRRHVDERYGDRMLLAEANQWPEDAVTYLGSGRGDECHTAFHFPVMPRLFMAMRTESRFPVIDILEQTPPVPETAQWVLFLRNHDELTLEMVTDEERDYMYRVFAYDPRARINLGIRRRLAPLLDNDRRKIELMNGLLFSLPGTPVIYYADEIGMGDNIYLGDRNGVRTPMQWSADRNAGFSRGNPQRLYLPVITDPQYHHEAINVEAQQQNSHSLLWWMRHLIGLRKRFQAFGRGSLEFLYPRNHRVLAFIRVHGEERVLVVANLSRFAQFVEIDLRAYDGVTPVELFGRTEFPPIGELPYLVTLGPYAFYWFSLEARPERDGRAPKGERERELPVLHTRESWTDVFSERRRTELTDALLDWMPRRRWFRSKARTVRRARVRDVVAAGADPEGPRILLLEIEFDEGEPQTYVVPLAFVSGDRAAHIADHVRHAAVAQVRGPEDGPAGLLCDPLHDPAFCAGLLDDIARRRRLKGREGEVAATPARTLRRLMAGASKGELEPRLMGAEQSNTSVIYGDRLVLKLYRAVEEGLNPDLEVGRFLTESARFEHTPLLAGALEYRREGAQPMTLGVLQTYVTNNGDAWQYTLDALGRFLDRVRESRGQDRLGPVPREPLLELAGRSPTPQVQERIGTYLESARLLGVRTAELHLALASDAEDPDFAPEPFSTLYLRSLYQLMRTQNATVLPLLRARAEGLPEQERTYAQRVVALEPAILERYRALTERKIGGMRIRVHGDYHLGQVLYTGRDFVIIDFEGEPARPLGERRIKRSPLRDVAGMLRSFQYAAFTALERHAAEIEGPEERADLRLGARTWHRWVSAVFLSAYFGRMEGSELLPADRGELQTLLEAFLLEKAVYEVSYELNNRPEWVHVPLQGILELVEERE